MAIAYEGQKRYLDAAKAYYDAVFIEPRDNRALDHLEELQLKHRHEFEDQEWLDDLVKAAKLLGHMVLRAN